ncbi:DEAD/DEAH box helicase [Mucilaginibacter robiniae]|uniref:DEAD/DEAH box helicase n=1 Tax=Mucilaginibacter robiniae TaxID=2728022 RepID=A0A7L5E3F2_9SPHI|nr:DEAD/DEAH box helicase [Mucilaginibacter robiniae]QJD94866.1 DEAD/DEAH box helicase [Mucilaginibacter robiniae]
MEQHYTGLNNFQHHYLLINYTVAQLTEGVLLQHSAGWLYDGVHAANVITETLSVDEGTFAVIVDRQVVATVKVEGQYQQVLLACTCQQTQQGLCEHQVQVLSFVLRKEDVKAFFDADLRYTKLKKVAADYGLENGTNLEQFFTIRYTDQQLIVLPKQASLLNASPRALQDMSERLFATDDIPANLSQDIADDYTRCIVLRQHKYYKHLLVELYDAAVTKEGKIKNPLTAVNPLTLISPDANASEIKFLTGVSYFQQVTDAKPLAVILNHLKAIVGNPFNYEIYAHRFDVSEKITAVALSPLQLNQTTENISLSVNLDAQFYQVIATLIVEGKVYNLGDLPLRYTYFIDLNNRLYLVENLQMLGLIQLFKGKAELLIHQSQYRQFRAKILSPLEERLPVQYTYIKPATPEQLQEQQFNNTPERIIYLSDFGKYVMIVPVLRYAEVEIPIRTQRLIYAVDDKGEEFLVRRDEAAEQAFMALLIKQHPLFEEQLDDSLQYFYLHRKRFLDADWFLNVFEEWRNQNITILGFNELSGNRLNPHKVKISIKVLSGIDWFNTKAKVYFGKHRASLKHLHKAIRNKSKFVQLDDGTQGILPDEWITRFSAFFEAGKVQDDTLITPKVNFALITELYDQEMLSEEVRHEIDTYQQRFANFENIQEVAVPAGLQAQLRPYQQQGLSWLNFLDDFNFGGCLADDMGLGKTIQIIAFILLQRSKVKHNTNLLVVPTSLIFNWQAEVEKFAPSIKILTTYGPDRARNIAKFDAHEIVLTTYGTLLSDVNYLKYYQFNYIFLDESQNIKNPESSRYKAVRLLQSRNKIAITGTPMENNTFDLFSQLSFACPGLLGGKQYFKEIYSSPIDQFKVNQRTTELQQRIQPFLLRRTKQEVAHELPDKTEMVLYCEMQLQQRKIYDAYEKEFREFISATTNEQLPQSSMHVLKGLTRLRQICNSPALLGDEKLPGEESSKINMLLEQIEVKAAQHKILVFSQYVHMLDLIKAELVSRNISFAYLTGSTRNREAVVNDFQNNSNTRVFLISLKAGGAGLNLTAADYVYLVDPWWNPAVENQAIDRCYRIGQHKNVMAVRLICPNTIEDKVQKLQSTKKELISKLIKNNGAIVNALTRTELLDLLTDDASPNWDY